MKKNFILLLLCLSYLLPSSIVAQETTVPFSIELEDVTPNNWPGLHSFAFAEWNDLWVVIGGRTNGLHGFFLATGFPVTSANDDIWVMNPETGDIWTYNVNELSDNLTEVLRSTNPQYVQKNNYLYFVGGYGKSLSTDEFTTFPSLTAINLDVLVPAIMNETSPVSAFEQLTDDRMKVCGGEMHELNGDFYLVGGNDFSGRYSDEEEPEFVQVYTNEIRRFNVSHEGGLSIDNYTAFGDEEHYHRRDFSLAPVIFPDDNQGLGLYAGVFRPDVNLPFVNPVYIGADEITVDMAYEQKMSHYTCPVIPLYNEDTQDMYSIFFGGISWHYYDHENQVFIKDDLVPFIDDITTFVKRADGTSTEVVLPVQFDQYLGANAIFIPSSGAPHYSNEVIQFHEISERILLGHIYGGIHAQIRNFTPSSASNRVFSVYLTPSMPLAIDPAIDDFSFNCHDGEVELNWSASPNLEMDYFEIEYALNTKKDWIVLRKIEATTALDYTWINTRDKTEEGGYYRLKRVQADGAQAYSKTIKSNCIDQFISLSIHPNPARSEIRIEFPNISNVHHPILLELTDMYGRLIQRELLSSDLQFNIEQLKKGVYQLRLKTAEDLIGQGRFLKM